MVVSSCLNLDKISLKPPTSQGGTLQRQFWKRQRTRGSWAEFFFGAVPVPQQWRSDMGPPDFFSPTLRWRVRYSLPPIHYKWTSKTLIYLYWIYSRLGPIKLRNVHLTPSLELRLSWFGLFGLFGGLISDAFPLKRNSYSPNGRISLAIHVKFMSNLEPFSWFWFGWCYLFFTVHIPVPQFPA